jgi:hypothetical protein
MKIGLLKNVEPSSLRLPLLGNARAAKIDNIIADLRRKPRGITYRTGLQDVNMGDLQPYAMKH